MRNPRIQRWAITLEEYGCNVEYVSGSKNKVADALSRVESDLTETKKNKQRVNVIDSDVNAGAPLGFQVESCPKIENEPNETKFGTFFKKYEHIMDLQRNDATLCQIMKDLSDKRNVEQNSSYTLIDGVLYHISDPDHCNRFPGLQVCIPANLQQTIMKEIHDGYFGGHFGIQKTYKKLRSRYFWTGMYEDVVSYVKLCDPCNMRILHKQKPP